MQCLHRARDGKRVVLQTGANPALQRNAVGSHLGCSAFAGKHPPQQTRARTRRYRCMPVLKKGANATALVGDNRRASAITSVRSPALKVVWFAPPPCELD